MGLCCGLMRNEINQAFEIGIEITIFDIKQTCNKRQWQTRIYSQIKIVDGN
jgi:hypothetical protein